MVQVEECRTDSEMLTQSARTMAAIKSQLPEYHTREMQRSFKLQFSHLAKLSPSIFEFMYKELTLDASAASNPVLQQRLRLIFLGETALLTDMTQNNSGRPTGKCDIFFEKMSEIIESVTAADERRHNIAHFSQWLSLKDLISQTVEICPPDTPVPSAALVRLQFTPRNPYIHTALSFTSKFQVQYKIQRRQLRLAHVDDHYCAALFLYMRSMAVKLREDCRLFCCDDKAKVPIGEPGTAISSGVRGRVSIAPSNTTLAASDHDVHSKGSLMPSVYLECNIPNETGKSFCRGSVTVAVNDSVFHGSNPFTHAAALVKIVKSTEVRKSVLLKYSDGGTDQRSALDSVKCSLICMFRELNLDMLIAGRTAPGQSWSNPAERIMSILNIALQNCALEREVCEDEVENLLKPCGSMKMI